ncbi:MAG: hypothetical protein C0456_16630 [Hyphomonas sp.]|jgi:hypothetical protein|uniref:hypothetical protein n=1 Tax=Hyphomonas sp. TaxID=87 RepID=UPI001D9C02D0|nr:hypothetical protein [Hyphomonas sp.]MBA4228241.1 hypothetical protein [Hyphomonas sp.]
MRIDHLRVYSDEDIENAMATVARVIELYGDAYWPILERLERELTERRAKAARLSSHLRRFQTRSRHSPTVNVRGRPI